LFFSACKPSDGHSRQSEESKPLDFGNPGHLRIRDFRQERIRTVLHQFCQRKATTDFHRAYPEG